MLHRRSDGQLNNDLMASLEPRLAKVWLGCVRKASRAVSAQALRAAMVANDVPKALALVNVGQGTFSAFSAELVAGYTRTIQEVADHTSLTLPVTDGLHDADTRVFVFEAVDAAMSRDLANVQAAVTRLVLEPGLTADEKTILLIGRTAAIQVNAANREGGTMGLTGQQIDWVMNARKELMQKPPGKGYFTRKLRDRSFDKLVAEAILTEAALPRAVIMRIITAYAEKLLREQARVRALQEAAKLVNSVRLRILIKSLANEGKDIRLATKEWVTRGDKKVRHTHKGLQGQRVNILDYFVSPSGAKLMAPHDKSAPISETAGCRCWFRARYKGRFI